MNIDFAYRAHSHSYKIDPIIRSLLDVDFYKLLMQQLVYTNHYFTRVEYAIINRTLSVDLAQEINRAELREQLEYCRTLRFTPSELIWLTGQTFYGQMGIFHKSYIDYLRTFQLPEFELSNDQNVFDLRFSGSWVEVKLWEIFAISIINEMRYREIMKKMSKSQLDIMYARAKVRLYDKLEILSNIEGLNLTDFGTRRRHSFLWQEHCVLTAMEVLGDKFTGTSNVHLAMKHNLEAKGTNAHSLPMVFAALAKNDEELKQSQYKVLREWEEFYRGNMLVFLPDTFGTTQFLRNAPPILAQTWAGARPDSKDPIVGGEELINWWKMHGVNPQEKLIIFSDGLDVNLDRRDAINMDNDIPTIQEHFKDRVKVGFGWGTNLTNDFRFNSEMKPISLVCKVASVNGKPAVKLSDVKSKATGEAEEVKRYQRVFGEEGIEIGPVLIV
jgi:nicotinate phosphoribosyltransferase